MTKIDAMQTTAGDAWRTQAVQNRQGSSGFLDARQGVGLSASEAEFQEQAGHPISHVVIPAAENATAIYAGAAVKDAPHPDAAKTWLDFIRSPEALQIFERYGFKSAIAR